MYLFLERYLFWRSRKWCSGVCALCNKCFWSAAWVSSPREFVFVTWTSGQRPRVLLTAAACFSLWAASRRSVPDWCSLLASRGSVCPTCGGTSSFCWRSSGTAWSWSSSGWHPACAPSWIGSSSRRSASPTSPSWSTMAACTRTGTSTAVVTGWPTSSTTPPSWRRETASRCSWATNPTLSACGSAWPRRAVRWLSSTPTSSPNLCCTASPLAGQQRWLLAQVTTHLLFRLSVTKPGLQLVRLQVFPVQIQATGSELSASKCCI